MKNIALLHNSGAGDGLFTKKELVELITSEGFDCRYSSTNEKGWEIIDPHTDFILIAGGDGTVRKVIRKLSQPGKPLVDCPIAILPLGTANNIFKSIGYKVTVKEIIQSLHQPVIKKYDLGSVAGLPEGKFFLEGIGFGIFPHVMRKAMKLEKKDEKEKEEKPAEEKIHTALNLMQQSIHTYEPKNCEVEIDGTSHSGKYLLAEIINTCFIGPNLLLSTHGDPGDGKLEIVLMDENDKDDFERYLSNKINGDKSPYPYRALKGKEIKIRWSGKSAHLDDKLLKLEKEQEISISINEGVLNFVVPQS